MSERIATLVASLKAKDEQIAKFYADLGDNDPTADQIKSIKDLNKEAEEEHHKLLELQEVAGIKSAASNRQTSLNAGTKSLVFPGSTPQTDAQEVKSIGQQWIDNDAIKSWQQSGAQGKSPSVRFEGLPYKTLVTGASSTQGGAFIVTDRQAFVEPGVFKRPLTIRDLVRVLTTNSDAVDYVRIGTPTNAAAVVPEATTTSDGAKPESAIATEVLTAVVKTIAHYIPVTRQALADSPQVRDLIDDFLRYGLAEEEEDQILNGSGVGNNFTGITNTSGTQTQAFSTDMLETLRKARTLVRLNARTIPTAYVLHPNDWQAIDLLQDNEARYYYGGPTALGVPRLWGLPVVESEAMTEGTAVVGDWRKAIIFDRQQTQIFVTDSHSDWFVRNIMAILAELRLAFAVTQPAAFVEVDLTA